MAFKMKAGKEGPMKKNFGSALNFNAGLRAASKAGKLDNNPKFKAAVDKAPTKAMKDKAPMMRMEKGAMKKMGSPNKIDFKKLKRAVSVDLHNAGSKIKKGFKDFYADLTGGQTSKEKSKIAERERELREMKKKNPKQFEESMKNFPDAVYDPDKKSKIRS